MKRTTRAGFRTAAVKTAAVATAATISAVALATAPTATAQTQVATVDVSQGSSEARPVGAVNGAGIVKALLGLAKSADGIANQGIVPTVEHKSGQVNIVLDPSVIPGLAEALAPTGANQLSTSMTGQTASGARVVFPTTGTYTSGYGMRWGAMHNGIDVANSIGTPIVAVMDGTVINSGPAQGFGNWIRIKHDDGSISVYGHMQADQLFVGVGERVSAGQQIAAIGSEGQSTGPHLHFEIWPDGANPSDPQVWFRQQGINF